MQSLRLNATCLVRKTKSSTLRIYIYLKLILFFLAFCPCTSIDGLICELQSLKHLQLPTDLYIRCVECDKNILGFPCKNEVS